MVEKKNRSDMNETRPFIKYYYPQLGQYAESNWSDTSILQAIIEELLFRKRAGARRLRKKITERLIELSKESFIWPSTAIMPSGEALDGDQFWYKEGILSFMGYRVGFSGVPSGNRRDILDFVYNEMLPRVNSHEYMAQWSSPKTGRRLRKMANTIAALSRNAKRNQFADMSAAIADWEADLEYIKRQYYVGKYDFIWPLTHILIKKVSNTGSNQLKVKHSAK